MTIINVKDFGAVGDGVTNDSAAFHAASLVGTMFIPAGAYLLQETHIFKFGAFGEGKDRTTIKHGPLVPNTTFITLGGFGPGFAGANLLELTIDGNQANNTGFTAMEVVMNYESVMRGCEIKNVNARGVDVASYGTRCKVIDSSFIGIGSATVGSLDAIWGLVDTTEGIQIRNNYFRDWRTNAIFVTGIGTIIDGNYITNCHIQTVPTGGGQIACGMMAQDAAMNIVSNNYLGPSGSTAASGMEINGHTKVTGNTIVGQKSTGIVLQYGSRNEVTNNTIKNCLGAAIAVASNLQEFSICGNNCYDDKPVKTQTYGIHIAYGSSDRYIINGNKIGDNLIGNLLDGGTGTDKIISGNQPGSTEHWISFSPTILQGVTPTFTVQYAKYRIIGSTAFLKIKVTFTGVTSGTAGSGIIIGGWPSILNPMEYGNNVIIGNCSLLDSGVGWYNGIAIADTATTLRTFSGGLATNVIGVSPSLSVTTNDILSINCSYEIA